MNWQRLDQDDNNPRYRALRVEAERRIDLAKKNGYVQWKKVYESPKSTIYHIRFRRFYYKDYNKLLLSVFVNPQSIVFDYKSFTADPTQGIKPSSKYIISFKGKHLRFYKDMGKGLKGFIPIKSDFIEKIVGKHRLIEAKEYKGLIRYHKRLITLFVRKCRENHIRYAPRKEYTDFNDWLAHSHYPVFRELHQYRPFEGDCDYDIKRLAIHFRGSFKEMLKSVTGGNGKMMTRLVLERYKSITGELGKYSAKRWANQLYMIYLLKRLLPLDYLYKIFDIEVPSHSITFVREDRKRFLAFFKHYQPARILEYLKEGYLNDTLNLYSQIIEAQPSFQLDTSIRKLKDIHDYLTKEQWKLRNQDGPIQNAQKLIDAKIDGTEVGDMTLILPKTRYELIAWGQQMSNCIGSYYDVVNNGRTWIIGAKRGDKIIYGIEIEPSTREIRQFRGEYNASPSEADQNIIIKCLIEKKILRAKDHEEIWVDNVIEQEQVLIPA